MILPVIMLPFLLFRQGLPLGGFRIFFNSLKAARSEWPFCDERCLLWVSDLSKLITDDVTDLVGITLSLALKVRATQS